MKVSGRNIKKRLYKLSLLKDEITRAKYYRGYGIHSPFVYGLIRKVFMCGKLYYPDNAPLYDALLSAGVVRKRAVQLQNAMSYCCGKTFGINGDGSADFNVVTVEYPTEKLAEAYEATKRHGTILVVMSPYANRERRDECRRIIESHKSTSVDNRGYTIILNNKLPKQHFRL